MWETVQSPHDYAEQNFRIFWVRMRFRGNVDDILWSAIKSVILKHVLLNRLFKKSDLCYENFPICNNSLSTVWIFVEIN